MRRVGIIPGDGIGPQLAAQAVKVLRYFQQTAGLDVEILELEACGAAIDRCRPRRKRRQQCVTPC